MTKATFSQRGETLDYKNATNKTIPAFTVISIGTIIGVAAADIEPGAIGAVHVTGVFEIPKTDQTEISQGAAVYFDGSGITASASTGEGDDAVNNILVGYAAETSAATKTSVIVKLRG